MFRFILVAISLWAVTALSVHANTRVALVIGNSDYEHAPLLTNPTNDARAISERLETLGFEVTLIENLHSHQSRRILGGFAAKAQEADVALMFYAGHGIELSGENYLIPVDAKLESEAEAEFEALPLRDVIRAVKDAKQLSIVMLDACRDNPFSGTIKRRNGSRSLGRGFALVDVEHKGLLISFAAEAGKTADDGEGVHSPYTQAVLDVLEEPGVEIGFVFRKVRNRVRNATNGQQVPIERMQLPDEAIYLVPPLPVAEPEPAPKPKPEIVTVFVPKPMAVPARPAEPTQTAQPVPELPKGPTKEELLAAAIKVNSPRGYALFIEKHGTDALASDAVTKAVNKMGVTVLRRRKPGELFEMVLSMDLETRKAVQSGLNAQGISVGTADGSFGPKSRRGISTLQAKLGIEETGYVNPAILKALGIAWSLPTTIPFSSSPVVANYDRDALALLGEDPKILEVLECLNWQKLIYAATEKSYYFAVVQNNSIIALRRTSQICGGHLATITSAEENAFIYGMIRHATRLFSPHYSNGYTSLDGPYFGLMQAEDGKEPRGGWHWGNGEPLDYTNWARGQPNEHKEGHDWGRFHVSRKGKVDAFSLKADTWNDEHGAWSFSYIMEIDRL